MGFKVIVAVVLICVILIGGIYFSIVEDASFISGLYFGFTACSGAGLLGLSCVTVLRVLHVI